MKPRLLFLSVLLICSVVVKAEPVDTTKALAVAQSFYNGVLFGKDATKSLDEFAFRLIDAPAAVIDRGGVKGPVTEHLYYIFNVGDGDGFVIVSGDDLAKPILGYANTGRFIIENQPPSLASWLGNYQAEITAIKESQQKPAASITGMWDELSSKAPIDPVFPVVGPLLAQIEWNQGLYYNAQCPEDTTTTCPEGGTAAPGGHVYAGCVATAMAQIMRYHSFPNQGILDGSWDHPDYPLQTADVTTTTYHWGIMPDALTSSSTIDETDAVSTLIAHCAALLHMDYGPCGSAAYTSDIHVELESHFGYAAGSYYDAMSNYEFSVWVDLLKAEIDAARPVSYRGSGSGGHSFVCDGYDAADRFHFNWGWSGYANGYFELTSLDPVTGYYYTDWQEANFQIKIPGDVFEPNNITSNATLLNYDPVEYDSIVIGEAATIDVLADQDIYMLNLPAGYDYQLSARVHDINNNAVGIFCSGDVQIEYHDGAWSSQYEYQTPEFTMINGGTVYFRVAGDNVPAMHNTGTYGIEITCSSVEKPVLYAGIVQPSPAATNQPVEFSVVYKDPANEAPSSLLVNIDGVDASMTAAAADFATGVTYSADSVFGTAGTVHYYFTAQTADGQSLRFPETGDLTFEVSGSPWNYDPADYLLSGQVTAKVFIDEIAVEGGYLGAFVNDTCRGYIAADYFAPSDHYVFMLMIHSNASGETIHFRYYDPVADTVILLLESLQFSSDMIVANALTPLEFTNRMTRVIPLVTGWNWVSLNVVSPDMTPGNLLPFCNTAGNYIKNQTESTEYYDTFGWYGSLDSLNCFDLYKIKMGSPCEFNYQGTTLEVPECIPLVRGWNYISFPVHDTLPAAEALSSLTPSEGDYIKSQTLSTEFYEGFGWFGGLEFFVPGDGFMVRLSEPDTLCFPYVVPPLESALKSLVDSREPAFQFDPHQYEYNGSVTAAVMDIDTEPGDILYAYVEGERRGQAPARWFEPSGNMVFSLMVYSNSADGEALSFVYYDASENAYFECMEQLTFENNMVINDALQAFALHLGTAVDIDRPDNSEGDRLNVYPNPFKELLVIDLDLPEASDVRIALYDIYGRLIDLVSEGRFEPGSHTFEYNAKGLPSGTYLLKSSSGSNLNIRRIVHIQ